MLVTAETEAFVPCGRDDPNCQGSQSNHCILTHDLTSCGENADDHCSQDDVRIAVRKVIAVVWGNSDDQDIAVRMLRIRCTLLRELKSAQDRKSDQ